MAATDPLVPGARARALREYVSVPESTNIARLRAFAADMWIALVRRNEIASEKAMEKPGDCKFFSGNTTGVSLQPAWRAGGGGLRSGKHRGLRRHPEVCEDHRGVSGPPAFLVS